MAAAHAVAWSRAHRAALARLADLVRAELPVHEVVAAAMAPR